MVVMCIQNETANYIICIVVISITISFIKSILYVPYCFQKRVTVPNHPQIASNTAVKTNNIRS